MLGIVQCVSIVCDFFVKRCFFFLPKVGEDISQSMGVGWMCVSVCRVSKVTQMTCNVKHNITQCRAKHWCVCEPGNNNVGCDIYIIRRLESEHGVTKFLFFVCLNCCYLGPNRMEPPPFFCVLTI